VEPNNQTPWAKGAKNVGYLVPPFFIPFLKCGQKLFGSTFLKGGC